MDQGWDPPRLATERGAPVPGQHQHGQGAEGDPGPENACYLATKWAARLVGFGPDDPVEEVQDAARKQLEADAGGHWVGGGSVVI